MSIDAPMNVAVMCVGSNAIDVTWDQPDDELSYAFAVFVREIDDKEFTLVYQTKEGGFEFRVLDLNEDTVHEVYVQSFGLQPGDKSDVLKIRTAKGAPCRAPQNLMAMESTVSELTVQWAPPEIVEGEIPSQIDGYKVYYDIEGDEEFTEVVVPADECMCTVVGLDPDGVYRLQVLAYNESGDGPESPVLRYRLKEQRTSPVKSDTSRRTSIVQTPPKSPTSVRLAGRQVQQGGAISSTSPFNPQYLIKKEEDAFKSKQTQTPPKKKKQPITFNTTKRSPRMSWPTKPPDTIGEVSKDMHAITINTDTDTDTDISTTVTISNSTTTDNADPSTNANANANTNTNNTTTTITNGNANTNSSNVVVSVTAVAAAAVPTLPVTPESGVVAVAPVNASKNGGTRLVPTVKVTPTLDPVIDKQLWLRTTRSQTIRGKRNAVKKTQERLILQEKKLQQDLNPVTRAIEREKESGQVVMYTTSLSTIRETYSECQVLMKMFYNLRIKVYTKDINMDKGYAKELAERLPNNGVPQVFRSGVHLGGFTDIFKMNERNELLTCFNGHDSQRSHLEDCQSCGGAGFVLCSWCGGTKKSTPVSNSFEKDYRKSALKCTVCNENGLERCREC